jgi:hypothetical protein
MCQKRTKAKQILVPVVRTILTNCKSTVLDWSVDFYVPLQHVYSTESVKNVTDTQDFVQHSSPARANNQLEVYQVDYQVVYQQQPTKTTDHQIIYNKIVQQKLHIYRVRVRL